MTAVVFRRLAILVASAALVSCLGGGGAGDDTAGGGGSALCEPIAGGNSSVTDGQPDFCPGCSIDRPEDAADGDLATFASITAPDTFSGQGVTIRVTAQRGIVFSDGQQVAVFFIPPTSSGFAMPSEAVTIKTYLNGDLQDNATSFTTRDPTATGTQYWMRSFTATKTFDAVEIMVSNTQAASMPFEIHEICSNTNLQ